MNKYDLYLKAKKVFFSCKTYDQYKTAENYVLRVRSKLRREEEFYLRDKLILMQENYFFSLSKGGIVRT